MNELLTTLFIYSAVPVTAWCLYMRLYNRMQAAGVVDSPDIQFFLIFTVYGGWLMVFFILISKVWTAMMYLVLVYLILAAPIMMLVIAISLISDYKLSGYHLWAFVASGAYTAICAFLIFVFIVALL
ncbi:MAG: hypothetical protein ICV60_07630 [Pyrinomonadaceae bacterium]|nr:hypothetical protein [Pyrinomonadaceae bacterium]